MTTLMQARLVDAGRVHWNSPVTELLPDFALADPAFTHALRLWHMSCACTGMLRQEERWRLEGTHAKGDATQVAKQLRDAPNAVRDATMQLVHTRFGNAFAQHVMDAIADGGTGIDARLGHFRSAISRDQRRLIGLATRLGGAGVEVTTAILAIAHAGLDKLAADDAQQVHSLLSALIDVLPLGLGLGLWGGPAVGAVMKLSSAVVRMGVTIAIPEAQTDLGKLEGELRREMRQAGGIGNEVKAGKHKEEDQQNRAEDRDERGHRVADNVDHAAGKLSELRGKLDNL